ncbi:ArnT family glycosyltransferase [Methylobrevis pamukkalensis]|uniref:Undecaprenyl phosphate-alpha-4-amino-4-deoxy-L-arabinose arabinosyl transferase n=1 Tax=Methylobrevis pamukkalensis TaxID=1439726 RepID=A0A1E3H1G2_9HYPH|nr:glycosyltransferase family 39 protein [Methylobrevis pamukkalensis]ODN70134.1 Undecaprenyl phosphate-alpha-4-amino-4-deoxy-L-arabinose arabinosyl transferase [Methylobrevis pamukkalensis]
MLETGDYVDIRLQTEPRYKKPIGIYWLQAASVKALGYDADAPIWAYRLPSLVAMVLSAVLVYLIGLSIAGPGVGLFAAAVFALSLIAGVEARLAKTDATLLAFILMAQLALARGFVGDTGRKRPWLAVLFWTAIGCGVLIKGPVILMVSGLTLLSLMVFSRSMRPLTVLYPLWGLLWALVLTLPWFLAIWQTAGSSFFSESLGKDFLAKVATGQENHGAPPGSFLVAAFVTFWPGIALLLLALPTVWAQRKTRPVGFLLAWALPSWAVFELVATKLPHYVMPLYPALALLTGLALAAGGLTFGGRWRKLAAGWIPLVALLLAGGLNAGFVIVEGHIDPYGIALAFAGAAVVIIGSIVMLRERPRFGLAIAAVGIVGIYATAYAWLLPRASHMWASNRIAEAVESRLTCAAPRLISVATVSRASSSCSARIWRSCLPTKARGASPKRTAPPLWWMLARMTPS